MTMSALESAKNARSACELTADSRITERRRGPPGPRGRSAQRDPAEDDRRDMAIVTPTMALVTVGRHTMKAVPSTSRGTPAATYMAASGHQRRSPWRMPAWPPMI